MNKKLRRVLLVALLIGLSGCTLLFRPIETPRVTLADLRLQEATLFEQRFFIQLRIQNPNSFVIPIEGVQFTLDLRGQPFAQGLSGEKVEVPALGSSILELEAVSTTLSLVRQLNQLQITGLPAILPYRVHGKLRAMGRDDLPFDYHGDIDLAGVLKKL